MNAWDELRDRITELTGRTRYKAMCRALERMP